MGVCCVQSQIAKNREDETLNNSTELQSQKNQNSQKQNKDTSLVPANTASTQPNTNQQSSSQQNTARSNKSNDSPTTKFVINQQDLIKGNQNVKIANIYTLLDPPLGIGSFGEVRKAIHKKTNLIRAVKIMNKVSNDKNQQNNQQQLINEVEIIKSLDHPNILKIYEWYQEGDKFYIVSELLTGGELFEKIIEEKSLNEKTASNYMHSILSAIAYCHQHKIVHRDLKPENLLLESKKPDAQLKIIDFGTSRKFNKSKNMKQQTGTLFYMAPEVFKGDYNEKCDIWSCGVIMYVLLCGYPPFQGSNDYQTIQQIQKGHVIFDDEEWGIISNQAKSMIRKMLDLDVNQRYSAEQALSDPWIRERQQNKVDTNIIQKTLSNLQSYRANSKLQQATWVFLVSQLSSNQEKKDLMNTFKSLDLNGDGVLSRQELLQGYLKYMSKEEAEREVEQILKIVDTNNSGEIDYSEFVAATINRQTLLSKERLETVFKMFDKDGNGSISAEELKEFFSNEQNQIDNQLWQELIQEVDQNGDGEIQLTEFKDMMMKLLQN